MFLDAARINQHQLIVLLLTTATCAAGVYLLHVPFHGWLHEAAGMSDKISDTAGTAIIILFSFMINNLVSMTIFKDVSLGMRAVQQQLDKKISGDEESINSAANDLGELAALIMRGNVQASGSGGGHCRKLSCSNAQAQLGRV
jgi:hypothetical protein